MDRRILFTFVFFLTLISTIIVVAIGILTHQKWLYTMLYALSTMWIMGVISQLLIKNVYLSIIRSTEILKAKEAARKISELEIDMNEVEKIDEILPTVDSNKVD